MGRRKVYLVPSEGEHRARCKHCRLEWSEGPGGKNCELGFEGEVGFEHSKRGEG